MAWLVQGCGAGGQKSWQSRVTQTPLRGANPFSFANCNINLSHAQPLKMVKAQVHSQCQGRLPRDGKNKHINYLQQRKSSFLP